MAGNSNNSWYSDPEVQAAMVKGGMDIFGGMLGGMGQAKEGEKERQFTGQQNAQQLLAQMLTNQFNQQQSNTLTRDGMAMNATQMNPLAQQQARANFALQGDQVNQWTPTKAKFDYDSGMGSFQGGYNSMSPSQFTKSFFTPEAMARAEMQDFRTPLQRITPGAPVDNPYGATGQPYANDISSYGKQLQTERLDNQKNYTGFANQLATNLAQNQQQQQQQHKKGGFWTGLGHFLTGQTGWQRKLAPIAAMAIPGLAPVVMAQQAFGAVRDIRNKKNAAQQQASQAIPQYGAMGPE